MIPAGVPAAVSRSLPASPGNMLAIRLCPALIAMLDTLAWCRRACTGADGSPARSTADRSRVAATTRRALIVGYVFGFRAGA